MQDRFVSISAISLIACLGAVPALAQTSSTGSTATTQPPSAAGEHGAAKSPSEVTCEELNQIDMMMVPNVLYFIAGHEHAKGEAGGSGATQSGTTTDTKAATEGTGSQAGATSSNESPQAKESPSSTAGGSAGTAAMDSGKSASDASAGAAGKADMADVVPVMGFRMIPVEETMIACGQEPSRRAADVMKEHQKAAQ